MKTKYSNKEFGFFEVWINNTYNPDFDLYKVNTKNIVFSTLIRITDSLFLKGFNEFSKNFNVRVYIEKFKKSQICDLPIIDKDNNIRFHCNLIIAIKKL